MRARTPRERKIARERRGGTPCERKIARKRRCKHKIARKGSIGGELPCCSIGRDRGALDWHGCGRSDRLGAVAVLPRIRSSFPQLG